MRYYRIHEIIKCVTDKESPLIAAYEVAPFPIEEANVVFFSLDKCPSDAVPIVQGDLKGKVRKINNKWECYGENYNVYFIFQNVLLAHQASFVHSAAVAWEGKGVLFWGAGGIGKTAISLGALIEPRMRLLADDVAIIRSDGYILSFHKPFAIYSYHLPLLGRRSKKYSPLISIAEIIKRFTPFWLLGRRLKRWIIRSKAPGKGLVAKMNPGWIAIPVHEIIDKTQLADKSHLYAIVHLVRYGEKTRVEEINLQETLRLIPITYRELEMERALFDYAGVGLVDLNEHLKMCYEIVEKSTSKAAHYRIYLPTNANIQTTQRLMMEILKELTR